MKKLVTIINFILLLNIFVSAQEPVDTSWKNGGFIGLSFNQVNLSQWAAGGENSLSFAGTISLFANYVKDKNEWDNNFDVNYALIRSGSEKIHTSDDRIELNSKYGRRLSKNWLLSFIANFKTQFSPGYKYPDDSTVISKFFSPAYLTLSPGLTYKPVDFFEVFISPVASKFTYVNDKLLSDAGAYGVDSGKTFRSEFGAYVNVKFAKDIMENVNLTSKLELFNNYTDKDKDNAKAIDVNWDTSLKMKVNNYITASVSAIVIYDADVIERTQFKEMVGIGFGYKFK